MKRVGLLAALLSAALAVFPGSSAVGQVGSAKGFVRGTDPAGDVVAQGLTKAERDALDIVSVELAGEEGLGLFARVTFKGSFASAVGRGHLKSALAALILQPRAGSSSSPAMLVSAGPGAGQGYRRTKSTDVWIVRRGRVLLFAIVGPGYDSVGSVSVETIVQGPKLLTRAPAAVGQGPVVFPLDDGSAEAIAKKQAADRHQGVLDHLNSLTCDQFKQIPLWGFVAAGVSLSELEDLYKKRCGDQAGGGGGTAGPPPAVPPVSLTLIAGTPCEIGGSVNVLVTAAVAGATAPVIVRGTYTGVDFQETPFSIQMAAGPNNSQTGSVTLSAPKSNNTYEIDAQASVGTGPPIATASTSVDVSTSHLSSCP